MRSVPSPNDVRRRVRRFKRAVRTRRKAMRKRNRKAGWFLLLGLLTRGDDPRGRLLRTSYEDNVADVRARYVERWMSWRRGRLSR